MITDIPGLPLEEQARHWGLMLTLRDCPLADLWFLAKMFSQLHTTVGKLQSPQLTQKLPCTYLIPLAVWCGHILVWFVVHSGALAGLLLQEQE